MIMATPARRTRESITHWSNAGSDGFGGFTFGSPTLLKGRWEERAEIYTTDEGEEAVSTSIVYLYDVVSEGDYLSLGDDATVPVANPTSLATAHRVKQHMRTTDLRVLRSLHKVYL